MDHDDWDLSICAVCDLTARLRSELQQAWSVLAVAEGQLAVAVGAAMDAPRAERELLREVKACRARARAVASLLADVARCHGDCHAACA